jgi:hypothetical protein
VSIGRHQPSLTDRALHAKRESRTVDFKRSFDPESPGDWCELIKDLVAMANSGGGHILIGVEDAGATGQPGAADKVLALDSAHVTDKVAKYTGVQVEDFSIADGYRDGRLIGIISVGSAARPLVFEKPGTYALPDGKQKSAFSVGSLYVRHGAKSEPANSSDLARIVERAVQAARKEWMNGVRKIVNAPSGSQIALLPGGVRQSSEPDATPIRITNDAAAPEYRLVDPDATYPWRQKELIGEVNKALPSASRINQFDIQAVRHIHHIDTDTRFCYKGRFTPRQYSPEFCQWLVDSYNADSGFFQNARDAFGSRRPG